MINFFILCFGALSLCDAGFIPSVLVYPHFPDLKTVHHGQGATSYQNVNIENFGSVPIPKDLQVDDGHEYEHRRSEYIDLIEEKNNHDPTSVELHNYLQTNGNIEHSVVSTEAPYDLHEHSEDSEIHSEHNYVPESNYENYDHAVEYEYH